MEKSTENVVEDAKDSNEEEGKVGFEIESSQAKQITEEFSSVGDLINHDKGVSKDDVDNLDTSIKQIRINVGGEGMTVEEAEKIPDLKQNVGIWQEIREGNFSRQKDLTFITDEIAELLAEHDEIYLPHVTSMSGSVAKILTKHNGNLGLQGLVILPDEVAECLGKHKGGELNFANLTSLSDTAATHLIGFDDSLYLPSLSHISDTVAKCLSETTSWLTLSGISTISDKAAEYFGNFKGEKLDLSGIITLSNHAAKHLAKYQGELTIGYEDKFARKVARYKK